MTKKPELQLNVTDEDLTAALMGRMDPANARMLQATMELYMKYGKAFVQSWADMNGRLLAAAAERVEIARAAESLEEQGRLVGKHSFDALTQAMQEYARFSHQSMVLWSSLSKTRPDYSRLKDDAMPDVPAAEPKASAPAKGRAGKNGG